MSTVCSITRCNEENDTIVGNSTSCSASCGSRTEVRGGMRSMMILGTSITCSATGMSASKNWSTSTNCSPICATGTSRICNLLHGTLLIPLLWPPRLTQTGWPGTPRRHHVFFVRKHVVLGASVLLSPWGVVLGPGRLVG